ncbi:uncharacterized protein Bfra_007179, partial [Botrytis fragariae]
TNQDWEDLFLRWEHQLCNQNGLCVEFLAIPAVKSDLKTSLRRLTGCWDATITEAVPSGELMSTRH